MNTKHLLGKYPRILSAGIQFADDDHLKEQAHEKIEDGKGGGGGGGEGKVELEHKPAPGFEERKADFLGKFAASKNAPVEQGGSVSNEGNKNRIEAAKEDAARQEEVNRQQREQGTKKKEGSNVPKIIEDKRKAETERDELKKKVDEFEGTIKPDLDKKIAEYEAKIASGDFSSKKEKEFSDKITALEKEKLEKEETLVNENKKLKDRLKFYDLQNDEGFHEEFIVPVEEAHKIAVEALAGDQNKMGAFHRALIANQAVLRATTPEDRKRAIADRNSILSSLLEGMDEYTASTFKSATFDYIRHAERHAKALQEHERTTAELREKARRIAENGQAEVLESWGKTYKTTAEAFKQDETISDEEVKMAKELGMDVKADLERSNIIAQKVVVGQSTMNDAIAMVHQGRVYPIQRARIKVLEKQLADREAIIAKLRKSGTGGGEGGGPAARPEVKEKTTREQFHQKFSANRPGIKAS